MTETPQHSITSLETARDLTATGTKKKKNLAAASIIQHFAIKWGKILDNTHWGIQRINKKHVALGSGKSHCCDQLSRLFTARSVKDAKFKQWVDRPRRKQTWRKLHAPSAPHGKFSSDPLQIRRAAHVYVTSSQLLRMYRKVKTDLFILCEVVWRQHLKRYGAGVLVFFQPLHI